MPDIDLKNPSVRFGVSFKKKVFKSIKTHSRDYIMLIKNKMRGGEGGGANAQKNVGVDKNKKQDYPI